MSRTPHCFLACYLILIKNGKIMLSKRQNTGYQDGRYSMIAGHIEEGESVWDAMVREAREEAAMELDPRQFKMEHIMHRHDVDREYIDFFMSPTGGYGEPKNVEPDKCIELRWVDMDRLPDEIVSYIRQAIESIRKGEFYSEWRV